MFNWIKGLFFARSKRRVIFRYWNGERTVLGDPFAIWRGLLHHPQMNLETMAGMLDAGIEPESTTVLNGLAEVFGLKRFDPRTGIGLTDWEIKDVLVAYEAYLGLLKKSTSPGPTSSQPTDSTSSIGQEAPAEAASASSP
jgi:hypothetical protein